MKRISLFILSIIFLGLLHSKEIGNFKLTEESDSQYKINFTIDDIELKSEGEYTRLISKSKGSTSEIGMPKLPLFTSMIKVFKGDEYTIEYEIKSSRKSWYWYYS